LILDDLLEAVEDELARAQSLQSHPPEGGGPEGVAALLQTLDRATADHWLAELEEKSPALAAKVRELGFRFGDLQRLTPKSLADLIRDMPNADWKLALRGVSPAVVAAICAGMSPRVAAQLREDLADGPKARQVDVETAQRQIADRARQLVDEGRLRLADGPDKYV
jgi:flagellar motor switch protein FliG